jgi:zinc resistance-associated protein
MQTQDHKENTVNTLTVKIALTMALTLAVALGSAGIALARHHAYQNMTPEQYQAVQEGYAEFDRTTEPLRRQMYAKQAELDALYYRDVPQNDPKVQALVKEVADLDARLYAAGQDLNKRLNDKGVPAYGGMGNRPGCPMWGMPGYGHGGGMMGHGPMRRGGCGW